MLVCLFTAALSVTCLYCHVFASPISVIQMQSCPQDKVLLPSLQLLRPGRDGGWWRTPFHSYLSSVYFFLSSGPIIHVNQVLMSWEGGRGQHSEMYFFFQGPSTRVLTESSSVPPQVQILPGLRQMRAGVVRTHICRTPVTCSCWSPRNFLCCSFAGFLCNALLNIYRIQDGE